MKSYQYSPKTIKKFASCWQCVFAEHDEVDPVVFCRRGKFRVISDQYGIGNPISCEKFVQKQKKPLARATDSENKLPF